MKKTMAASVQNRTGNRTRWLIYPLAAGLAVAGWIVYANSLRGVFVLDDHLHIVQNERIRQLRPLWPLLSVRRPVVELTLAANYAVGQLDPKGYHLFNFAIHALAGLTLFGVVRRSLLFAADGLRSNGIAGARALWISWSVALLWLIHPLNTQAVTYVVQRGESLMGLFYLLTLYCAIRAWSSPRAALWHAGAVVSCALGMASKSVIITAPIVVLLYDRVFLFRSQTNYGMAAQDETRPDFGSLMRRRRALYAGLALTWAIPFLIGDATKILSASLPQAGVGFSNKNFTPWEYLESQPRSLLRYVKLSFWPVELCLDYSWKVARGWSEAGRPAILVGGVILLTLAALFRRPAIGFLGVWFFLILAPTSSFIPIKDLIFEHRMYLSLAAIVAACVLSGHWILSLVSRLLRFPAPLKWTVGAIAVGAVAWPLGKTTIVRNRYYQSELRIWQRVLEVEPNNARAWVSVANGHLASRNYVAAVKSAEKAVELQPDFDMAYMPLGAALESLGKHDEAIHVYRKALLVNPEFGVAYYNMGNAWVSKGRNGEAIQSFRECIKRLPKFAEVRVNLANALERVGQPEAALEEYREAVKINPGHPIARNNLGDALLRGGLVEEGIAELSAAIQINPDYAAAHANLARALLRKGDLEKAWVHAQEAMRLDPKDPRAKNAFSAVQSQRNARQGP